MSNTSLILQGNRALTPSTWGMIKEIAPVMHVSRLFGVSSPEQAMAIMLKGHELGLGITSSFEFIHVIDGKTSLSPRGALALIQAQGVLDKYKAESIEKDGKFFGYSVYMKRGDVEHTATFTLDDAKRAQLTEGSPTGSGKRGYGNWEKYPENMCLWRAVGFAADFICPDITGGLTTYLKMPEVFSVDVDSEGNFIDAKPIVNEISKAIEAPKISLDALVESFGAEAVFEAAGNKMPASNEELAMVSEKLMNAGA